MFAVKRAVPARFHLIPAAKEMRCNPRGSTVAIEAEVIPKGFCDRGRLR